VTERPDAALVEACLQGDRTAYAELVKRHAGHAYAICLAIVGIVPDAQDLAQEALVKGFVELDSLKNHERFGAWIAAIAGNLSRNFIRRRANHERLLAMQTDCGHEDSDRLSDLRRMLWRLPENYRIPLMLYFFDGRTTESIAATLDISPGAVYTRLRRARDELRSLLENAEARDEE
jgi:RNA polymerase sigma-70 factor (ECF subfamily)